MSFPEVMVLVGTGLLCLLLTWLLLVLIVAHVRPALIHLLVPTAVAAMLGIASPSHAQQDGHSGGEAPDLAGLSVPDRPYITAPETEPETEPDTPPRDTVTVQSGDTLWAIAAAHLPVATDDAAIAHAVHAWHATNRVVLGDDPNLIKPGQVLTPPEEPS